MDQTIDSAKIDERAEINNRGHNAVADLALCQLVKECVANRTLGLLKPRAARQHHVVAVLVEFNDLGLKRFPDVRLQVSDPSHLNERGGKEPAQTNIDDQAALNHLDDSAFYDTVLVLNLFNRAPGALILGALLGKNQTTFLVLLLQHKCLNRITDGNHLSGINVVLDGQFTGGDDAFGFIADVEEYLVSVNLDDDAFNDVSIVEIFYGLINSCEEVFGAADVIHGNTGWGGWGHGRVVR